ncbi:hypothetical protein Ae168Ps1_6203 [Pseudonocardia sp. Ae168_Ps1]|uniref:hypothetical protein n=1 Tax=unclassified Pseudonocardia TaxID=2619320 RepID=UPI00094B2AB3|nr:MULTISPECIES: hypothetical protein [unclassified Pseudonocardia]OLL70456.1 hypothetical protein Ae168Ps1_6203 [Pseudonocardia sp. Ae168_Ps1]
MTTVEFDHGDDELPDDRSRRRDVFLPESDVDPDLFPTIHNISTARLFDRVIRATDPELPEYIALDGLVRPSLEMVGAIGQWNMVWEAAQFRRRFFDIDELPAAVAAIADLGDLNVVFVPRTRSRYHEYAPLIHLLPRRTLCRFGLPLLRGGQWPFMADYDGVDDFLPGDFADRLSRAWASTVWRHMDSGSGLAAFTRDEPLHVLAHNLDFWVPAVTEMIQNRLRERPELDKGRSLPTTVTLEDGGDLDGAVVCHPRVGGPVWLGEDDAVDAVAETVELADRTGQLRSIVDAVRSNRVVDDFSDRWSFAREDFERKLFSKRSRIGVRFVELTDTIPVQGPESEIVGRSVTNEFLSLLDARNRQIVVLLNSGVTNRSEIAEQLGYAGHSTVSKRLAQIRDQATAFFGPE